MGKKRVGKGAANASLAETKPTLADKVGQLVRENRNEAFLAVRRLAPRWSLWEAKRRHQEQHSNLLAVCQNLDLPEFHRRHAQQLLDEHAAGTVAWDEGSMPIRFLGDLGMRAASGVDELFSGMNAQSQWNLVVVHHMLTYEDVSGLGLEGVITAWGGGEQTDGRGRHTVGERLRGDDLLWRWFEERVERACGQLSARSRAVRVKDFLGALERFQRLHQALVILHGDLVQPKNLMDDESSGAVLSVARPLATGMAGALAAGPAGNGAIEPVRAIEQPLVLTLAGLARSRHDSPAARAEKIREAVDVLEAYVRPHDDWAPLPERVDIASGPGDDWRQASWFKKVVEEFMINSVPFDVGSLLIAGRAGRLAGGFRPGRPGVQSEYRVEVVCQCTSFAAYSDVWRNAVADKFVPRQRGPKKGS